MDNNDLQELIKEAGYRGGGMILNLNSRPAAVVLTIDKYNKILGQSQNLSAEENTQNSLQEQSMVNNKKLKILVTGGAGYIGAHVARQLLAEGYETLVLDNLSTGLRENVPAGAVFLEGDLADMNLLRDIFAAHNFYAVMHLAASLEVEESVREPQKYFNNNVLGTANLLAAMDEAGVRRIIFSSTCAVYDPQNAMPINEQSAIKPLSPYGFTKKTGEDLINYYCNFAGMRAVVFRYFNACGCDFDGAIQDTHETHLIHVVMQAAKGERPYITVNGSDYSTTDGTCVRDYVHVLDIAGAHLKALEKMDVLKNDFEVYNIGTGRGSSVKEVINAASEALNKIIPMEMGPRRPGDAPEMVADNSKLNSQLGYKLQYSDLQNILSTAWNQANNRVTAEI
ncbi:MAG: UDP-glucose 4-epimerase GalE [Patescibacteria group bacterium]|nr:UDP-glucose 4-epimerase GalE [Patescibacteria group bacterium]